MRFTEMKKYNLWTKLITYLWNIRSMKIGLTIKNINRVVIGEFFPFSRIFVISNNSSTFLFSQVFAAIQTLNFHFDYKVRKRTSRQIFILYRNLIYFSVAAHICFCYKFSLWNESSYLLSIFAWRKSLF